MPRKSKSFFWVKFPPEAIQEGLATFDAFRRRGEPKYVRDDAARRVVLPSYEQWDLDTDEEFFAEYRADSVLYASYRRREFELSYWARAYHDLSRTRSDLAVRMPTRAEVEGVYAVFESWVERSRVAEPAAPPSVFIGHGRDPEWKDLRDELHDLHHLEVRSFESAPRAGQTVRDVLEQELDQDSFALLVHTAEDEQADTTMRARQNVIHETGLFQGVLGFERALVVREDGCAPFSNVDGVQELRYARGHIREVASQIVATLVREFGSIT